MSTPFATGTTVRMRRPMSPAEGRLATIVAIEARPYDPRGDLYQLRFPDGDECHLYAFEIRPCSREIDRRSIINALTAAANKLRAACLIAHDYDNQALSAEILFAFSQIVGTARTHLDTDLHPPQPAEETGSGPDGDPR